MGRAPAARAPHDLADLLHKATLRLAACRVDSPRLDAELLMAHAMEIDRGALAALLAGSAGRGPLVDEPTAARYRRLVKRRALREPLAYITRRREFWSLELEVGPDVLIPRPETELLVQAALALLPAPSGRTLLAADVGTGSGAIAIALARERADLKVAAVDISEAALRVACRNSARHEVSGRVALVCSDLLEALAGSFDLVAANLPYVDEAEAPSLPPEVARFEPSGAVFSGDGGLAAIRRLLPRAGRLVAEGGWLLLEVGAGQAATVQALLRDDGSWGEPVALADLAGHGRVVQAQRLGTQGGEA